MSDARPRRAARDSARSGPAPAEEAPAAVAAPDAPPDPVAEQNPAVNHVADVKLEPELAPPAIQEPVISGPAAAASAAADDAWTALVEVQRALARACEEIAVEVAGISRSGIAAGTDAALALLGARTFAEAVEINAGMARRGFDAMVEGSARLSEIGVKAVAEASRPILTRLSVSWSAAGPG
jgi:hypothetical protein